MHKARSLFLTSAAALIAFFGLFGSARPAAQEAQNAPASAPSETLQSQEPQQGTGQPADDQGGTKKKKTQGRVKPSGVGLQAGSTLPPKNLKKVGDHWTPYDPPDPESFPPDATLHVIVPGDTLWDLADLAFGNPYLWPQIWNENRYITDSHWIYPGDPLLLPARPTVVSEVVPQGQEGAPPPPEAAVPTQPEQIAPPEETEQQPAEAPEAETPAPPAAPTHKAADTAHAPRTLPKLESFADDYDLRCSGFIAPREEKPDYFITNQEDEAKSGLTEGDIVYLNRGRLNGHTEPGTEYSVVMREGEVRHPVTHKFLGHYYKRLGSVKVLAAQDATAIAAISMACDEIRTGQALVPLYITPLPARPAPAFSRLTVVSLDKPSGYIVHVLDDQERAGVGQVVDIDLGYDDGLKAGDFLTVFLPSEPFTHYAKVKYDYEWRNRRFQSPQYWRDDNNLPPPKVIGQLVVIFTEKKTAAAKILQSTREIEVGDSVVVY
ncbi:MAG TPA: LysM peptidoglycan-binding domain-containing protein [Candidatus Dormibacteraeota bacterium]|nr:LysM peptidoglycan-binding domain-containing protein [Candidatus Dormibacteraeota bacterium]